MKEKYIYGEKLTKEYFLSLSTGKYLVSTCGVDIYTPNFCGYIVASEHREGQWQRIKYSKAAYRRCLLFYCIEDYEEFVECLLKQSERKLANSN